MSMQMSSDRASLVLSEPATARLYNARVHSDGTITWMEIEVTERHATRTIHLSLQAPDVDSLRSIVDAMQAGLEQLRPVPAPATEAHVAIEAHSDAESGAVGVAGR